jgi:hypothetical protein
MAERLTHPVGGNSVLLFGPQALSFDAKAFQQLRSTILETEDLRWILDAVSELPECLDVFSKEHTHFATTEKTRTQLQELKDWFEKGDLPDQAFVLPNSLLTPLVIITHLIQYGKYLELSNPPAGKGEDLYALPKGGRETLGFCTGLLTAFAVSSSENREEFMRYGAVALRLGMLIGLVVDSQDDSSGAGISRSLATVWNSAEAGEEMNRIVKGFPEVRESVRSLNLYFG